MSSSMVEAESKPAMPGPSKPTATVHGTVNTTAANVKLAKEQLEQEQRMRDMAPFLQAAINGVSAQRKRAATGSDGGSLNTSSSSEDSSALPPPNKMPSRGDVTLDLTSRETAKKSLQQTPDILSVLKLPTPEIDRLFANGKIELPTPTPTKLFQGSVTSPQKQYAQGFLDALKALQNVNNFTPSTPHLISPGLVSNVVSAPSKSPAHSPITPSLLATLQSKAASAFSPARSATQPTPQQAINIAALLKQVRVVPHVSETLQYLKNTPTPSSPKPGASLANLAELFALNTPTSNASDLASMIKKMSYQPTHTYHMLGESSAGVPMDTSYLPQGHAPAPQHGGYPLKMEGGLAAHVLKHEPPHMVEQPYYGQVPVDAYNMMDAHNMPSTSARAMTSPMSEESLYGGHSVMPLEPHAQEEHKVERKRERNRVAASKCRQRKIDRIGTLEEEVKRQRHVETQLARMHKALKDDVIALQCKLREHKSSGCLIESKAIASVEPTLRHI